MTAARVKFIKHLDKEILHLDFSNSTPGEVLQTIETAKKSDLRQA
jgi:hypothetical protein